LSISSRVVRHHHESADPAAHQEENPMSVEAIPSGMHTLTPHLVCQDANSAIDWYVKAFGAVEVARMKGPDGKLMHGQVKIGDSFMMLAEEFPAWGSLSPTTLKNSPVFLHLYVPDVDASIAKAAAAGATVTMPATDMFWGDRYGQLVDPYGHKWSLATHVKDMTPAEMQEGMKNMQSPDCG
jgi:PhnB protein